MSNALNLFDMFSSNKESEENGRWFELDDNTAFKLRAFGAKAVIDLRDDLMRPHQTLIRVGGKLTDDKNEEIGLRVIAGGVIADWRGVANEAGEVVPYSADEAYKILKALPKLASFIVQYSTDSQNYRDEARQAGVGNS
ncbi:hypothetical protein KIKIMORA_03490 [Brevundimonas phage vB_BpoS-Kikimora]|uniref:Tail assembly chaperone n=1 Tax=Brevundimonas phage vB_BpoS-Kikimora TaxID=2948601 RepID=A0A9E7SL70_9CAUD|nr:hypothetical protein KIKIMORA_03490 [Brevundimonas phage vB_BpoS-Kikimora]